MQIHNIMHCTSGILQLNLFNSCQSLKFLNQFKFPLLISECFFVLKSLVNIEVKITSIDFELKKIYILKKVIEI